MWLLKAAIFFTLFAFALNNQQIVAVYFFFGTLWKAPLVLVVLAAFGAGMAVGVLVMMPRWWKKRKTTITHSTVSPDMDNLSGKSENLATLPDTSSIPRHGL